MMDDQSQSYMFETDSDAIEVRADETYCDWEMHLTWLSAVDGTCVRIKSRQAPDTGLGNWPIEYALDFYLAHKVHGITLVMVQP